jgi:rubrerythrin
MKKTKPESVPKAETIDVIKRNWRAEVETAEVYRDLASREQNEKRKGILLRMAEAEERPAQRWEQKLRDLGLEAPVLKDTIARRLNRWWNKVAGTDIAIRRMEAAEEKHEAEFRDQRERALAGEDDVQDFFARARWKKKRTRGP